MAKTDSSTDYSLIGLPKKEWLTLEEIAERWQCKPDDLLSYAGEGKLGICFFFNSARVNWFIAKENNYMHEQDEILTSQGMFRLSNSTIRCLMNSDEAQADFLYLYPCVGQDFQNGHVVFENNTKLYAADTITRRGLRISRLEADRFEKANRIGLQADDMPKLDEQATDQRAPPRLKVDKQIDAILAVIKLKKWDALKIHDGDKGTIEDIVCKDPQVMRLFEAYTSFETAWKAARKRGLVKMENHDSFAKTNS